LDKQFDPLLSVDNAGVYATGKRYFTAGRLLRLVAWSEGAQLFYLNLCNFQLAFHLTPVLVLGQYFICQSISNLNQEIAND